MCFFMVGSRYEVCGHVSFRVLSFLWVVFVYVECAGLRNICRVSGVR